MENVPQTNEKKEAQSEAEAPVEKKEESTPVIEAAKVEADRLEKIRDDLKAENDRTELLRAKQTLGGRAEAGASSPETQKLSDEEFANKLQEGEASTKDFLDTKADE